MSNNYRDQKKEKVRMKRRRNALSRAINTDPHWTKKRIVPSRNKEDDMEDINVRNYEEYYDDDDT